MAESSANPAMGFAVMAERAANTAFHSAVLAESVGNTATGSAVLAESSANTAEPSAVLPTPSAVMSARTAALAARPAPDPGDPAVMSLRDAVLLARAAVEPTGSCAGSEALYESRGPDPRKGEAPCVASAFPPRSLQALRPCSSCSLSWWGIRRMRRRALRPPFVASLYKSLILSL